MLILDNLGECFDELRVEKGKLLKGLLKKLLELLKTALTHNYVCVILS